MPHSHPPHSNKKLLIPSKQNTILQHPRHCNIVDKTRKKNNSVGWAYKIKLGKLRQHRISWTGGVFYGPRTAHLGLQKNTSLFVVVFSRWGKLDIKSQVRTENVIQSPEETLACETRPVLFSWSALNIIREKKYRN